MGLSVERDGKIVIRVPQDCPQHIIDIFFEKKKFWIYQKLAEKRIFEQDYPEKEYVAGEGFHYLGKTYQLILVDNDNPLRLYRGFFELSRKDSKNGREVFIDWYREHALNIINQRINRYSDRFQKKPEGVRVIDLKYRWGSCTSGNTLNFHWKTILAPMRILDYIVVHEMVHLVEKNHTPEFWEIIKAILPDYEERKEWLKINGKYLDI